MKKRKCFRCGKELDYESFIKNCSPGLIDYYSELWENDYIEFYCCHCYNIKIKYQNFTI